MSWLKVIFGDPSAGFLRSAKPMVARVNTLEHENQKLSDAELKAKTTEFKKRLEAGETLEDLLPQAFACVREAAHRVLGQRHFDVQLMGGLALHRGRIAEMKTGEGKTLTATLAVYLNALAGRGVHVVTVNDYLAARDASWMGRVYDFLGMSVGCIQHESAFLYDPGYKKPETRNPNDQINPKSEIQTIEIFRVEHEYLRPVERREAYNADITYGTNNEFGFDYLRDNMVTNLAAMVQRGFSYAIVDEVDSILIDEARTPLIISGPAHEATELYYRFADIARQLREGEHYTVDEKLRTAILTDSGITQIEHLAGLSNLYAPEAIKQLHHAENAVKSKALFLRDREYVVKAEHEGEAPQIIIVDEFTGRLMYGRRYSEGLHQAIEAKEGLNVRRESETLATITFQNYFRLYKKLAGMTGTAATEAEEFRRTYGLEVATIPTNQPMVRQDKTDRVYATEKAKLNAIATEVKERQARGQPVLVGTISVEKNERLHELFKRASIEHEILNAKNHEREAAIIAQAGRPGAVTLATNMAGRGVDIILGGNPPDPQSAKKVKEAGGLFVLGTERHESRRIDNQLRGRSGRQGDAGGSQFYVSLEDDLMRIFGSDRAKRLLERLGLPEDVPVEHRLVSRSIATAQEKVEAHNYDLRKHLLQYDDVLNRHRETIYRKRREILEIKEGTREGSVRDEILNMAIGAIERIVLTHTRAEAEATWNLDQVLADLRAIYPAHDNLRERLQEITRQAGDRAEDAAVRTRLLEIIGEDIELAYVALETKINKEIPHDAHGPEPMRLIELQMILRTIDAFWIEHLQGMEDLREGIGLRGWGQRDPLIEYKREGFKLFQELLVAIDNQVAYSIFKISVGLEVAPTGARLAPAADQNKIGRNDPCPCGAIKADGQPIKYKFCHGKG